MYRWILVGITVLGIGAGGQTPPTGLDTVTQKKLDAQVARIKGKDGEERIKAVAEIAKLDPRVAVPALVGILAMPDEDVRLNACLALGVIGKAAVPALEKALADPHETVRFYAVWALGLVGPAAKSAAPAVIKATGDADEEVRYKAAFTLARIAPDSEEALAALVKALSDSDPDVVTEAGASLAKVGPPAVATLRKALANPKTAYLAADALSQMARSEDADAAKAAATALPDILRAFDGGRPSDTPTLQVILQGFGVKALPAFKEAVKDKNPESRARLAMALGLIGMEAEGQGDAGGVHGVLELLIKLLADDDPRVRMAACVPIGSISLHLELTQPALEKAFDDELHGVSFMAVQMLRNRGLAPEGIQDKLAKRIAVAKGDAKLRLACLDPERHFRLLMDNLKHPDAALRLRVAAGLTTCMGGRPDVADIAKKVEPILAEALKSPQVARRRDAAQSLVRMASWASGTAIAEAALKDADADVRVTAMAALLPTPGRDLKKVAALFAGLVHDPDGNVQQTALNLLGQCGDAATPQLMLLLKDREMPIRAIACNILKQRKDDSDAFAKALVAMAQDADSRWFAANTMHEIAAAKSFGLLFEVLQADKQVGPALRRVDKAGKDPAKVIAALLQDLKDTDSKRSRGAMAALEEVLVILPPGETLVLKHQNVVPAVKAMAPRLSNELSAARAEDRLQVVDRLASLHSLTGTLEGRLATSPNDQVAALNGEIAALRQELEAVLQKATADSDARVRRAARQALRAGALFDGFAVPAFGRFPFGVPLP